MHYLVISVSEQAPDDLFQKSLVKELALPQCVYLN